jgi:hypothetical protein
MTWQPDLFGASTDPIVGIEVRLQRSCECGREIFTMGHGSGPHRASLRCTQCGRHGGWVSHKSGQFLEKIVASFGKPTTPIVIRARNAQDAAESTSAVQPDCNVTAQ